MPLNSGVSVEPNPISNIVTPGVNDLLPMPMSHNNQRLSAFESNLYSTEVATAAPIVKGNANVNKASGNYSVEDVINEIKLSPTAKKILDDSSPKIVMDSKKGAYYDQSKNVVHLRKNADLSTNISSLAHELGHVKQKALNINSPKVKKSTRQDFIDGYIMNEVEADNTRHQIYSELGANTVMKIPYGHSAWQAAPKEKKAQVIKDRFVGPKAVYKASTNGKTYTDNYGDFWDKHNPKP